MIDREVSILIPTYNRPDTLARVFRTYCEQGGVLEILILDDGSSLSYHPHLSHLKIVAEAYGIDFRYSKSEQNLGAGATRNRGIAEARGRYILWGEDDAFLGRDYVATLLELVRDGKTFACGSIYYGITPEMSEPDRALIVNRQQNSARALFDFRTLEGYYRRVVEIPTEVPWGHALILVPLTAYENVRYYEGYRVNGYREETDAQVLMGSAGYNCLYTSRCACYHFPADNAKSGQHTAARAIQELYTVVNTWKFIKRHWGTLRDMPGFTGTARAAGIRFGMYRFKTLSSGAVRKLRQLAS